MMCIAGQVLSVLEHFAKHALIIIVNGSVS